MAVSPEVYWPAVAVAGATCAAVCVAARTRPGSWRIVCARVIGLALAADAVVYSLGLVVAGTWSASSSLPLALCDVGVIVAAVACWWRLSPLVELTYFWGLAGTLQAVITPDLNVGFPHLLFFEFLVGHLGIVLAAVFLVVGLRLPPRPGAVPRVFAITAGYTVFVGFVDAVTGANYMFLRDPPAEWTLLQVLGPWPWYVLSAAGVALVLLVLLDLPFWRSRRRARAGAEQITPPRWPARGDGHALPTLRVPGRQLDAAG